MLDILKSIIFGIVQGITEWLPISSTGHLLLVNEFLKMDVSTEFMNMFKVVIQLASALAVVVLYFHKLNPFSPRKNERQKKNTISLWCKVIVGCIPAGIIGILFDDVIDKYLSTYIVIGITLLVYGILFIVVENRNASMTKGNKIERAYLSDCIFDRMLSGACTDSGNIPFRCNNHWSAADWCFQKCCGRVYIFPGNPNDVWGQRREASETWF